MKRKAASAALVVSLVLLLAAVLSNCGGGGSGSSSDGGGTSGKVQLSGAIDRSVGSYQIAAKPSSLYFARVLSYLGFASPAHAVAVDPTVNKVIAIPIYSGSLAAYNMPNSQTVDIDPGTGVFSLSLDTDRDWVLMLINTNVTGTSRFVGSVAINTGTDNLLNFPATDSTLTTMSLGTVQRSSPNGDALTSRTVGTSEFSLTTAQISAIAKTDKFFRNAMNIVNNYEQFGNGGGKWYQLRPDFSWSGNLSSLVSSGSLSSAPSLTYRGMNFQLDQNVDAVPMNDICNTAGVVALHPPLSAGVITIGTNTYSYTNPIKNSGSGCTLVNGGAAQITNYSGIYATNAYENISFSVIDSFANSTIPAGFWEWKEYGVTKAAFDIANINPPITTTGQLKGFIPAYKINTDSNKKITSVDIAWYFYDGGVYTALTASDVKVVKHFVQNVEAKFDVTYNGTRRTCEMYIDPTLTSFNPADPAFAETCQADTTHKDWYYNDPTHPETNVTFGSYNSSLIGFYESGGFGYFFSYQ